MTSALIENSGETRRPLVSEILRFASEEERLAEAIRPVCETDGLSRSVVDEEPGEPAHPEAKLQALSNDMERRKLEKVFSIAVVALSCHSREYPRDPQEVMFAFQDPSIPFQVWDGGIEALADGASDECWKDGRKPRPIAKKLFSCTAKSRSEVFCRTWNLALQSNEHLRKENSSSTLSLPLLTARKWDPTLCVLRNWPLEVRTDSYRRCQTRCCLCGIEDINLLCSAMLVAKDVEKVMPS